MSQKGRKKKPKIKKTAFRDKQWFTVLAPKSFNFKSIGEVIGTESNVVGRTVEILLFDITDNFSDISLKLKFKIINVNLEGSKCESIFVGHEYTNDYIRSLIGRGSSKIVTIINLTTKDRYIFRLTVVCTTIRSARSSQQIIIRKIMSEILGEFAASLNHEKFITGMIYGEFQNQIQRVAKTIYPLSNSTVIKSKLISIPEGGEDKEFIPQEEEFEVVEVAVKRSRKSDIKRTERINVKKYTQTKAPPSAPKESPKPAEEAKETGE